MGKKKKETILFVDDEESILNIAEEYFSRKDYHVITAKNGFEALEVLETEKIDCCFTDINMPEMDGLELAEYIRKIDNTVPVVVMTGFPSLDNTIRTMKNGVVDFLIKPVNLSQMELCVQRVLRERRLFVENIILKQEVEKKAQLEKLSRELRYKVEELHILNEIMSEFSKVSNSEDIFHRLVNMTLEITHADEAKFYVINDNVASPVEVTAAFTDMHNTSALLKKDCTKDLIIEVVSEKMPLLIPENQKSQRLPSGVHSFMIVPMTIRGKNFGVLTAAIYHNQYVFTEKSLYYLSFMTQKAAYVLENLALYENIYENLFTVLLALVKALEAKDSDTGQHSKRVTRVAIALAKEMECTPEELDILNVAGRLHDIGKIGIKDDILQKPGKLTKEEFETIKEHPVIGSNIVGQLGLWNKEQEIIRHHHERFDGTGYPDGLKGEKIPLLARILSVADAYDAMAYDRIYRKKIEKKEVLRKIKEGAETQFDPNVVKAFQRLCSNGKILMVGARGFEPPTP